MNRPDLRSTGVVSLLIAAVTVGNAMAQPSPANSTLPASIRVCSTDLNGLPDPTAVFTVVIRDENNDPMPGVVVDVDLTNCFDTRISNQSDGSINPSLPGQTVVCRAVQVTTNELGQATISILGAATNLSAATSAGAGQGCVRFFVANVLLGTATAAVFDQNGAANPTSELDGVEISDLSRWLADFGNGIYYGRSDYNYLSSPGSIGIDDLSVFWAKYTELRWRGGDGGAGYCP